MVSYTILLKLEFTTRPLNMIQIDIYMYI